MKKEIKAIETSYKGLKFRSRLEARVALFLDKCAIAWEYEPEGYVTKTEYNPDFYLPDFDTWIEVKGKRPGYEMEILKAREHIVWGGPIRVLVFISEIPDVSEPGLPHFPCSYYSVHGIKDGWAFFSDENGIRVSSADYPGPYISKEYIGETKFARFDFINKKVTGGPLFDISPKSDYLLKRNRDFLNNRSYRGADLQIHTFISDHDATDWEAYIRKVNSKTFQAFREARSADFTMRKVS